MTPDLLTRTTDYVERSLKGKHGYQEGKDLLTEIHAEADAVSGVEVERLTRDLVAALVRLLRGLK